MSDDDMSDSSSEGEDLSTTGLIATRAKRATAGNLYATLRQNLDDEELQRDLLAEDEEDAGDYEGDDKDDDDAMSSSDDDDDQGPLKEGEQDLEGEKELKRQERAAAKKKRKMDEAKMRLPAWQKKKKVKLADDAKTEDGQPASKPKKKSERSNWLPSAADMPVRQSSRASAVANREMVHSNLVESNERSEKQKKVMAKHSERQKANARQQLTQEERFAKAAKIEKETAREFGRWEREEAERQRIREEQLAAKRKRGIDGPVIRHWSGSVLWEGDKIKETRLHGSQRIEELAEGQPGPAPSAEADISGIDADPDGSSTNAAAPPNTLSTPLQVATPGFAGSRPLQPAPPPEIQPAPQQPPAEPSWLDGIHAYANQPEPSPSMHSHAHVLAPNPYTPSAPAINAPQYQTSLPPLAPQLVPEQYSVANQPSVYHGWPPGYNQFPLGNSQPPAQVPLPPVPPAPLIKQQAQRSLIMLEHFENLDVTEKVKKPATTGRTKTDGSVGPTPIASALLPSSYPSFTAEEARYLTSRPRKLTTKVDTILPVCPAKARCAFTPWPAKFKDPKTGLPYADLLQYKMIQRLLAGGCQWSAILGCWVGPAYGSIGRPAAGVPDGFGVPIEAKVRNIEGDTDVKMEDVDS